MTYPQIIFLCFQGQNYSAASPMTLKSNVSHMHKACPKQVKQGQAQKLDPLLEAAVTSYHKVGDSKQQKFTLSQFWRSETQNQHTELKSRQLATCDDRGLESVPCLLQLPVANSIPWLVAASLQSLPPASLFKDSVMAFMCDLRT